MKERIYQGVIGVLVVVVSVAIYNIYENSSIQEEKKVVLSSDISNSKPKYKRINLDELYAKQRNDKRVQSIKLDTTLADYKKSMQKSISMIHEYNRDHPNNKITLDTDFSSNDTQLYKQETLSLDTIQQKTDSINKKFEQSTQINSDTSTNSYAGDYGGSSGSSSNAISTANDIANASTPQPIQKSATQDNSEQRNEILAYKTSISTITKVIEQINANLN